MLKLSKLILQVHERIVILEVQKNYNIVIINYSSRQRYAVGLLLTYLDVATHDLNYLMFDIS